MHGDALADFDARYARADFDDCAAEFVAEGYGDCFFGYGVRCSRGEGWAAEEFVEVWSRQMVSDE